MAVDVIQLPSIHQFELRDKGIKIDLRHTSGTGDRYVCKHCGIEGYDVGFIGHFVRVMDTERKINYCAYPLRGAKPPKAIRITYVYPQMQPLNFAVGNTYLVVRGRKPNTFFNVWVRHCGELYYIPRECFVGIKRADVDAGKTRQNIAELEQAKRYAQVERKYKLERELRRREFAKGLKT